MPDEGAARRVEVVDLAAGEGDVDPAVGYHRRTQHPVGHAGAPANGAVGLVDGVEGPACAGCAAGPGDVRDPVQGAQLTTEPRLARELRRPGHRVRRRIDRVHTAAGVDRDDAAGVVGQAGGADVRRPARTCGQRAVEQRPLPQVGMAVDDQRMRGLPDLGAPSSGQRRNGRVVELGARVVAVDLEAHLLSGRRANVRCWKRRRDGRPRSGIPAGRTGAEDLQVPGVGNGDRAITRTQPPEQVRLFVELLDGAAGCATPDQLSGGGVDREQGTVETGRVDDPVDDHRRRQG